MIRIKDLDVEIESILLDLPLIVPTEENAERIALVLEIFDDVNITKTIFGILHKLPEGTNVFLESMTGRQRVLHPGVIIRFDENRRLFSISCRSGNMKSADKIIIMEDEVEVNVGDRVWARYADGNFYICTIHSYDASSDMFEVNWEDGDSHNRKKKRSEFIKLTTEPTYPINSLVNKSRKFLYLNAYLN